MILLQYNSQPFQTIEERAALRICPSTRLADAGLQQGSVPTLNFAIAAIILPGFEDSKTHRSCCMSSAGLCINLINRLAVLYAMST
jgi:hypothetical protein